MKYNIYDDDTFFEKYSQMSRSIHGLDGAGEWNTLKQMLPDFADKRVLDLGCGYGWHCQYAIEQGATSVIGVDISEKMLQVAKEKTSADITYIRESLVDVELSDNDFDVVISSLAFHYLESFEAIVTNVARWLAAGGDFVFSVEHPIFTAQGTQDWYRDADGNILHFPVDRYFDEGQRDANFLDVTVKKYHHTLTTYLNTLITHNFEITGIVEPQPSADLLDTVAGMRDELRRPMMLLISARKHG